MAKLQAKWLIVSCTPFALHFYPQRCLSLQISWITCVLCTEIVTNQCYVNRQITVSIINKYQTTVDQFWLTDQQTKVISDWLTDCWSCTAFCCDSFPLLWQLCTVGDGNFYMADVNNFLLINYIMLISTDIYFKTVFEWQSLAWQFASLTPWALQFFEHISQSSVATRLGFVRVFKYDFATNILLSLTLKEFWQEAQLLPRDHAMCRVS